MTQRTHRTTWARVAGAAAAVLALLPLAPLPPAVGEAEPPPIESPRFKEVGRVPLTTTSWTPEVPPENGLADESSGWMIINPVSRRGYTFVESAWLLGYTFVQSFDLDTLQPRRRALINGGLIPSGNGSGGAIGTAENAGEFVHAVDPAARRIYLPIFAASPEPMVYRPGWEAQRPVHYLLVLDEDAFDRDPSRAFGVFGFPVGQERLMRYDLVGMAVSRHHVGDDRPGKLLAVFASLNGTSSATASATMVHFPGVWEHWLVQWDPSGVATGQPPPPPQVQPTPPPGALPVASDWQQVLTACAAAPLSGNGDNGDSEFAKQFQWGILARRDAVYLGCQSAPRSGAVVRVPLDARTGGLLPSILEDRTGGLSPDPQRLFSLGKPVGDVLVDEGGGRLLLRSFSTGGGQSWWIFDAGDLRFAGSVAGHVADARAMGAGVDPTTGRLYMLLMHSCVARAANGALDSGQIGIRGGLKIADSRLDPVPAADNILPELAYPTLDRVQVDPVTRRVFVRRGMRRDQYQPSYPNCASQPDAPVEPFYRVYQDLIPVAEQPAGLDDSTLTTDVPEAAGLTEASYLGSGSGFGSRALLVGGVDAASRGAPTDARSLCGRDDRELIAGSVGKVELSDQSTLAEAAALDADGRTQEALADPVSRCRPQAPPQPVPQVSPQQPGPKNFEELNRCHGDLDAREAAFDQAQPPGTDANKDGCTDRDGRNRYAARCVEAGGEKSPGFDDQRVAPRDGFEARVACDERDEKASASSAAAGALDGLGEVRVARSSSTVSVVRKAGSGITVKVDSIARGVELPGVGTIGVVRAEATSTATGRDRAAGTTFTRTICDVDVGGLVVPGCLSDGAQHTLVSRLNEALGGRGTVRLRTPDPTFAKGTPKGYLAAVQRDRKDLFADQVLARDRSLAVPALEVILYQGEGGKWGAGRQIVQLAGVQASTSYGIACLNGRKADGSCAAVGEEAVPASLFDDGDQGQGSDDSIVTTVTEQVPGGSASLDGPAALTAAGKESLVTRLLRALPRAVAEALRLLFNNPRELGLLLALWALLYLPCYLGDRRRAVRAVAARRLVSAID
ncbi:MAG: hypothetical protein M3394_02200 [Actinomycetota bacterium]|nr:hypothetical protein [Actinomycetota bacterium]